MLKLNKEAPKAVPVPLGAGAVLYVRPATSSEYFLVQSKALRIAAGFAEGDQAAVQAALILGDEFSRGDPGDRDWIAAVSNRLLLIELAAVCAESWSGVAIEDGEGEAPLNLENLALLLRDPALAKRVQSVLDAGVHAELAEKKGSAASQNGAAAAAAPTAPAVEPMASPAPAAAAAETDGAARN